MTLNDVEFKLIRFNPRRQSRGAEAAEVEVDEIRLWMSEKDIRNNMKLYGAHPELQKALDHYKSRVEFPAK